MFDKSNKIVEQYLPVNVVKEFHAKGCTDGNIITLRKYKYVAMSETLMHEFTHYLNHFTEEKKSQNQEEVEAEIGAMLYGSYFNLDISGKYKYIALWKDDDIRIDVALCSFEQLLYGTPDTTGLIDLIEGEDKND